MPYSIRKLPNQNLYRVYNTQTKEIHSYGTTLENAKKQVKLLHMVDAGVPLKKQGGSIQHPKLLEMFKGTGSVGKQAKKMGFQVTSLDFDPIYTPDIETDVLDWDYKKFSNENNYVPDMIWASPPCNTFSPMVYRLKEREVETAKPISDRAKLGTKILYKTLEIIDYFRSKNPKLLFIIENPRGMMRKDARMKKLARETTLYCIYGDFKKKPTDFWTNFPNGLQLDQDTKQCPNKVVPVQNLRTIEERYSMPSKLIKHFLEEFKKQYGEKVGGSIETDKFESEGIVSLPEFRSVKLDLPTYMYKRLPDIVKKDGSVVPPPYRYRLVIPITSSRNLSSRLKETSLNINQKPVSKPIVKVNEPNYEPKLEEFSPADRRKLQTYYSNVKYNERKNPDEINKDHYEIVQRGFPLPCDNPKPKKPKPIKVPKEKKVKEPKEKKPRGRPKKVKQVQLVGPDEYIDDEGRIVVVNPEIDFPEGASDISFPSSVKSKSTASSKSSKSSKSSISSAKSSSSTKSKSSIASLSSLESFDPDALLEDVLGGKGINNISTNNNKMANSWVQYVKEYASKNGISYRDALRDPNCKAGYKKGGAIDPLSAAAFGILGTTGLLAGRHLYNERQRRRVGIENRLARDGRPAVVVNPPAITTTETRPQGGQGLEQSPQLAGRRYISL